MKKWVLAAAAAVGMAGAANGAVLTLESVTTLGANNFRFNYQGTLGPDEGVRSGDQLVIFDFAGFIPGSILTPSPNVVGTAQLLTPTATVTPGFNDDPTLFNLVFTYVGPDFRNTGGPFTPFDFDGLSARSTFNGLTRDAFFTQTTKNNPDGTPGGSNTPVFTLGSVTVPAIPEPATWAMMLGGFGLVGATMRRRVRVTRVMA